MTTAAYLRVSTQRQTDKHGTKSQEDVLRDRLARDGIEAVWYTEDGARSGRGLAGRAAMLRLMDDIKAGAVTRVYSFSFSRLFRSVRDAAGYISLTIEKNVTTLCVSDGFTIDPSSPFSKAMAQMAAVFAELSADCIREAATAGIRAQIASGKPWGGRRVFRVTPKPGKRSSGCRRYSDVEEWKIAHEDGSNETVAGRHRCSPASVWKYRRKWLHAGTPPGAADSQPVDAADTPAGALV
mgnify:CR=1 FL=1